MTDYTSSDWNDANNTCRNSYGNKKWTARWDHS